MAAVGLLVLGPLLAWLRAVPALVGFAVFALGGLLAVVVALLGVIRGVRGRGLGGGVIVGTVAAILFVVLAARGRGAPMINDYTTDLADPPTYKQAAADPANTGRDLSYPAGFADQQRACCADLTPVQLQVPAAAGFAMVELVARDMPDWTITRREMSAGEVEAVATTKVFGFKDDIIIRVRPDPPGGSHVDMRSKSRDGKGDQGVNAARIRAFRAALAARAAQSK